MVFGVWSHIGRGSEAVCHVVEGRDRCNIPDIAIGKARLTQPLAIIVASGTPVRVAPYGAASPATALQAGAALLVVRHYGAWLEVRRVDGVRGWVLASEVVRL